MDPPINERLRSPSVVILFTITFPNLAILVIGLFFSSVWELQGVGALLANLVVDILLLGVFLAWLHRFGLSREDLQLKTPPNLNISIKSYLIIFPLFLGISYFFEILAELLGSELSSPYTEFFDVADNLPSVIVVIMLFVVIAPVSEEIILRGGLLPLLLKRDFSENTAVVTQAIIFMAMHYSVWVGASIFFVLDHMITTFMIGVVAGYLFLRTRIVWSCIILHMAFNGLSTFSSIIPSSALSFFDIVVLIIIVLGLFFLVQKRRIIFQYGRAIYFALTQYKKEQRHMLVETLVLIAIIPGILEIFFGEYLNPILPFAVLIMVFGYSGDVNLMISLLMLLIFIGYWLILFISSISNRPFE